MDDIVPGVLQRLREADIVGLAGLAAASLGQEYARNAYVSATKRQGTRLSGTVTLPDTSSLPMNVRSDVELPEKTEEYSGLLSAPVRPFIVEVDLTGSNSCQVVCTCGNQAALICAHAAALLYQWIHHPYAFVLFAPVAEAEVVSVPAGDPVAVSSQEHQMSDVPAGPPASLSASSYTPLPVRSLPVNTIGETLAQFSLSELRATAREYGIVVTNLGKQQLMETMIETLSQPEAVRRVVGALAKAQRQLLAAFALAGGSMSDEELRGLFERFALDSAGSLQDMLVALQAKLLLVRTSFNHSLQQRLNLHMAPLDISWYIPQEVREALHVTLPVTRFDVTVPYGKNGSSVLPTLRLAEPYKLLEDMLLVGRALDGEADEQSDKRSSRNASSLSATRLTADGSLALPPPEDRLSLTTISALQAQLQQSAGFLHFAFRLLRLNDILYKEDNWTAHLRILPNAARLLLGPARNDVLHDLFTRWMNQVSYAELFELAESGIRVRCRATPLNQPALRRGELEQENSEARQELLSLLARIPAGEWINFSAFARFVYRLHPTFLQRRQRLFSSPHWWIEQEEGRPLQPTQLPDWLRAEGRYLLALIQGPLHWLGLCDLAFSSNNQLLAFRLTPLTDFLFQGVPPGEPEKQDESVPLDVPVRTVSAEELVLIPCSAANWPLISCIEDFAVSTGIQQGQLCYRLNAQSLSAAISQGRDPRALLTLLGQTDIRKEPPAFRQLLVNLEHRIANYGRVRLYTDVSLVQVADASIMQQLDAIISLDEQTIRTVHPTLLVLKKQGIERLLEELKRRGQVPLVHEEG